MTGEQKQPHEGICKEKLEQIKNGDTNWEEKIADPWQYILDVMPEHDAAIAAAAYEKCMDDFGILHGEDAKRFNEYLEKPPVMTEEGRETIRRAHEIVKDMKKKECSEFVEEAIKQYRERIRNMISKSRIFEDFTVLDILAIIDEGEKP